MRDIKPSKIPLSWALGFRILYDLILRIESGCNYNGIERLKIQSRYLGRNARQSTYRSWLRANEISKLNKELSNCIFNALQKTQGNTQKISQELDNSII